MRYYIIDNMGNICGESSSRTGIEVLFSSFSSDEIEKCELEIITDMEGEKYGKEILFRQ